MIINTSSLAAAFASVQNLPSHRQHSVEPAGTADSASRTPDETKITISQAAREALASPQDTSSPEPDNSIEARLAKIKASKERTADDMDFLLANDKKLAEIEARGDANQTSADIDYVQKARGFVNTMANLSTGEKALYDELVAKGNSAAAAAISQIAFIREMGHTAGGPDGTAYDPINTEITAESILKLFRHSIPQANPRTSSRPWFSTSKPGRKLRHASDAPSAKHDRTSRPPNVKSR